MEAEVVQMCVDLFNGGEGACGTVCNPGLHFYVTCFCKVKLI